MFIVKFDIKIDDFYEIDWLSSFREEMIGIFWRSIYF